MDEPKHFLFIIDRQKDRFISNDCHGTDTKKVTIEYRAELLYADQILTDIVRAGSDSLETIKKTHRIHFGGEVLMNIGNTFAAFSLLQLLHFICLRLRHYVGL